MKNERILWGCAFLCLPTIAVVLLGLYFLIDKVPEAVRQERRRVLMEYRQQVLELREDPSKDRILKGREIAKGRGADWERAGKMTPGSWGVLRNDGPLQIFSPSGSVALVCSRLPVGKRMVWYDNGAGRTQAWLADYVEESDLALAFWGWGMAFLLVLVGITVAGMRYFIRYVKSRDDFLAATAHDLTTPLVGMRMMIGRCDDEAKRLNERMLLIVSNIKDFLKLGGKRRQPELKPVDIVALAKEAYELFAADYEDSEGGAVAFDCGRLQSTAVEVLADETLALQILWNLFGNDLKYAAPYGKVEVRFAADGNFVRVEFVDEGQGMTPRQMKRAFDRYYRAKTVLQSGKGGFGIGLCTAREFARQMGGDLTVRPNDPKGCVFTLSLALRSGSHVPAAPRR